MSNQDTTPIEDAENIHDQPAEAADNNGADEKAAPKQETLAELEQALAEARKQANNFSEGWQRERADFSNYKRRAERDLLTMRFNAKIDTLKTMLPVLDDFERAMTNLPDDLKSHGWLEGISAIHRKFIKTLEDEGVEAIDPTGDLFDPNLHEAIGRDESTDVESGHITATLQKGYICGDRVLRPALVRVAE